MIKFLFSLDDLDDLPVVNEEQGSVICEEDIFTDGKHT